ncbi:hypothetical protein RRF57_002625 [Xylaria bambusicola]|uniref:Uncharacterized protein n=1 Tax=Xylaria bambusicola TaxID=326684 RepID=A0AAN7U6L1_9PEZI
MGRSLRSSDPLDPTSSARTFQVDLDERTELMAGSLCLTPFVVERGVDKPWSVGLDHQVLVDMENRRDGRV